MKYVRFIPVVLSAAVSTFSLFYMMQGLIAHDEVILPEEKKPFFPDFLQNITPPEIRENDWKVDPPVTVEPPVQDTPKTIDRTTDTFNPIAPPVSQPRGPQPTVVDLGLADGQRTPLVQVAPMYPRRCAERGISGWVILEFDVSNQGLVENPKILADDGSGCFNRSALKTIQKFRYKPTTVNGKPLRSSNVQFRMSFDLEG